MAAPGFEPRAYGLRARRATTVPYGPTNHKLNCGCTATTQPAHPQQETERTTAGGLQRQQQRQQQDTAKAHSRSTEGNSRDNRRKQKDTAGNNRKHQRQQQETAGKHQEHTRTTAETTAGTQEDHSRETAGKQHEKNEFAIRLVSAAGVVLGVG